MNEIEEKLELLPNVVSQNYFDARGTLGRRLSEDDLLAWASKGLEISSKTVRSWEASAGFFKASVDVQRQLPAGQFVRWAGIGERLCTDSPNLAVAFFKASPDALTRLRPRYMEDWARLGRTLYRGTWKSSTLSCRFYDLTPNLLQHLSFDEFSRFADLLASISLHSYDLADQCLSDGIILFGQMGGEKETTISTARTIADRSWRDIRKFFEACSNSLVNLEVNYRSRFLSLTRKLMHADAINPAEFMVLGTSTLMGLKPEYRGRLLEISDGLTGISPGVVPDLIRNVPTILERISFSQFMEWHSEGLNILEENPKSATNYYRLESSRSLAMIDTLASGVELSRVRDIIRTYCRALAGQDVELVSTQNIVDKNIGWVDGDSATTEGTTIYLPPLVDRFPAKHNNFAWYKVVATHQVAHIEFGSFSFEYERASTIFKDLRPYLKSDSSTALIEEMPQDLVETIKQGGAERYGLTDMSRFFDKFEDRMLALDIFTVVEDVRLDARVMYEYKGIVSSYKDTQAHSLAERSKIEDLPLRQAMLEFIIRFSLGQRKKLRIPKDFRKTAKKIVKIISRLRSPNVTVEDTSEATMRVYSLISEVPNTQGTDEEFEDIDIDDQQSELEQEQREDTEFYLETLGGSGGTDDETEGSDDSHEEVTDEADDEEGYEGPQDVSYRGDFKPELAQLLAQLRLSPDQIDSDNINPVTEEKLAEMLERSAEVESETTEGETELQQVPDEVLQNLMKEMAKRDISDPQSSQGPFLHVDEDGGPLEPIDDNSYVYDEWDFRGNEYKPRWCLVHEKEMAEGDSALYHDTLQSHASLVRDIHRQFERMAPEAFRKLKHLEDGEDHDLDAVIEAMVDRRSGNQPSEKLFWMRNKVERDVAVAFLLDMSASTAEAIDESGRGGDDWGAPDDPVEYMVWLRSRRAEGLRRSYKRIVDIEKEGIILLANSLEMLGDTYGIYGFSGYGRENVEVYVIKDLNERFTDAVPRRIDRVAPLHATRMGPAIRHTTQKLIATEAKSRILFMITDGRPQDRGYSREGVEKEYAVHDTKQALLEARRENIIPFCLTVDKDGHDYMKTMMHDMSYEVLHDIRSLSQRLPELYRRLTT